MFVLLVNVQEWEPHCTGIVAKFLFVSKCPGIGAALYRNGIISILFSTIQLFKIETKFDWLSRIHVTFYRTPLPHTCYSSSSGNDSHPRGLQISLHIRSPAFSEMEGGYSRVNFDHLKSEVFWNGGGVFRSKLWSSQIWSFPKWGGGVFQSKLWSSQIWSFLKWGDGGLFQSKLWSSQIWSFLKWGGGLSGLKFQKGAFWKIWTKIYCSARNLLVHHR